MPRKRLAVFYRQATDRIETPVDIERLTPKRHRFFDYDYDNDNDK